MTQAERAEANRKYYDDWFYSVGYKQLEGWWSITTRALDRLITSRGCHTGEYHRGTERKCDHPLAGRNRVVEAGGRIRCRTCRNALQKIRDRRKK